MSAKCIVIWCCVLLALTSASSCKRGASETRSNAGVDEDPRSSGPTNDLAAAPVRTAKPTINRDDWRWEWRSDIQFWGKVVDQSNAPVAGALVEYEWTDLSKEGSSRLVLKTDSAGRTALSGVNGKRLVVRASMPGYEGVGVENVASCEYADTGDQFFYRGSSNKPTILRLRRKGPSDVIVHRANQLFDLTNRSVVAIDLLGQREVPEGSPDADLIVKVDPARQKVASDEARFPWKVVFEAPSGGVQLAEARGYLAPDHGYSTRIECIGDPNSADWDDRLEVWLFVRSRTNQVHSQLRIYVSPRPRFNPAAVRIQEYYSNPTGGRGLEYSRTNDVTEKYYIAR